MMQPDVCDVTGGPAWLGVSSGRSARARAFTLIEILIVVVILGIIASIVTVRFASATGDAKISATREQLAGLRTAIEIYAARYGAYPTEAAVQNNWEVLVSAGNFKEVPVNSYVGGENAAVIRFGAEPDSAFSTDHGWVYDEAGGRVWAAGFDGRDQPLEP